MDPAFLSNESGVETSLPREGIEIRQLNQTTRIATGTRDVEINGETFYASPSSRGEIEMSIAGNGGVLMVSLPMAHPIAQRYMAGGIPPDPISVKVWRKQIASSIVEMIWAGRVAKMDIARNDQMQLATFAIPSYLTAALARRVPTFGARRTCPHQFLDVNCKLPAASHTTDATVALFTGRVITITTLTPLATLWGPQGALGGYVVHVPSGERMTIINQSGNTLTMQFGIYELRSAHDLKIVRGCDRTMLTCDSVFLNRQNFGGANQLPINNPMLRTGFGTVTQS